MKAAAVRSRVPEELDEPASAPDAERSPGSDAPAGGQLECPSSHSFGTTKLKPLTLFVARAALKSSMLFGPMVPAGISWFVHSAEGVSELPFQVPATSSKFSAGLCFGA